MTQLKNLVLVMCAMLIMALVSCSSASLLDNSAAAATVTESPEAVISTSDVVDITVNLPDMGRGWDVAKYSVTATRTGETDVTQETTGTSLTMRLKVGDWSFVATGYDSNNNVIFLSDSGTHNVSESGSSINLILNQQSAAMKVSVASNTAGAVRNTIDRVVVTATPSVSGFDTVTGTSTSWDQSIILTGLLANTSYTLQVSGYRGDILYGQCNPFDVTANTTTSIIDAGTKQLTQKKVTPVTFSPVSGSTFGTSTKVTLSSTTTSDVAIYYTLDGTTPSSSSTKYTSSGITVDSTWSSGKTIKAIAVSTKTSNPLASSIVTEATYYYGAGMANPPSFSPVGGTFNSDITVALTNNETSGTLKYSLNGTSWSNYTSPIAVSGNGTTETIYAKVVGVTGKNDSAELSQTYVISYNSLGTIAITPGAGTYFTTQQFTMSAPLEGATIYYTTNGTDPSTSSTQYTGPFTLPAGGPYNIKAYCVKSGYADSEIVSLGSFTIVPDSSVTLTTAGNLIADSGIWATNGQPALIAGDNYFMATGLTASTKHEIKWMPSSLNPTITIKKNGLNESVTATKGTGKYTFTTGSDTSDTYYINFKLTEAAPKAIIGLGTNNSLKPVTAITIDPATVSGLRPGQSQTFSATYSPSGANMGTSVNWSVSNTSVLDLNGSTITVKTTGSSNVTATLDIDSSIKKSVSVSIGANITVNVKVHDWIWSDNAAVFAWAGIGDVGEWISVTKNTNDLEHVDITFAYDKSKLLLVRCPAGTTEPNWSITSGDGAGRIYNQTEDIPITTETTSIDTTSPDIWKSDGVQTKRINVTVPDWVIPYGNQECAIFAWAWDSSDQGAWYSVSKVDGTTLSISVPEGTAGFLLARCYPETTAPDWGASGDTLGRIYNKTGDVAITEATSYSPSWMEHNP